jgi:hypothetical protein
VTLDHLEQSVEARVLVRGAGAETIGGATERRGVRTLAHAVVGVEEFAG